MQLPVGHTGKQYNIKYKCHTLKSSTSDMTNYRNRPQRTTTEADWGAGNSNKLEKQTVMQCCDRLS